MLIVDDSATSRLILEEVLNEWGASADGVGDGTSALEALDRARRAGQPYGLVLLDHRMPDIRGGAVAEYVRSHPASQEKIVMMLTSDALSRDIARCRDMGIPHHLVKPVRRAELLRAIVAALGLSGVDGEGLTSGPQPDTHHTDQSLRILLVEDSKDNRLVVEAYLKNTVYRIDMAENGEIAVGKFISGDYGACLINRHP